MLACILAMGSLYIPQAVAAYRLVVSMIDIIGLVVMQVRVA